MLGKSYELEKNIKEVIEIFINYIKSKKDLEFTQSSDKYLEYKYKEAVVDNKEISSIIKSSINVTESMQVLENSLIIKSESTHKIFNMELTFVYTQKNENKTILNIEKNISLCKNISTFKKTINSFIEKSIEKRLLQIYGSSLQKAT